VNNLQTVQEIYEAFGRGDVQAIVDRMADDVQWERWETGNAAQDADVPYMRPRTGPDGVTGFFAEIAEDFEMNSFSPHTFLQGDGHVAAVIELELTVSGTGKRLRDEEIHLWGFDADGKVSSFRHFLDTAKAIEAHS
jgi:ketosteroid isomerase-like protein